MVPLIFTTHTWKNPSSLSGDTAPPLCSVRDSQVRSQLPPVLRAEFDMHPGHSAWCAWPGRTPPWAVVPVHLTLLSPSRALYQQVSSLQMRVPTSSCAIRQHLPRVSKCLCLLFPFKHLFLPRLGVFFFVCSATLVLWWVQEKSMACSLSGSSLVVKVEAVISLGLSVTEVPSEVSDSTLLKSYLILSPSTKVPL